MLHPKSCVHTLGLVWNMLRRKDIDRLSVDNVLLEKRSNGINRSAHHMCIHTYYVDICVEERVEHTKRAPTGESTHYKR